MGFSTCNSRLKNRQNTGFSKLHLASLGKRGEISEVFFAWVRISVEPHFLTNFEPINLPVKNVETYFRAYFPSHLGRLPLFGYSNY